MNAITVPVSSTVGIWAGAFAFTFPIRSTRPVELSVSERSYTSASFCESIVGSRLVASDTNTTWEPSPLIIGSVESPLPTAALSPVARLTSSVFAGSCRTNASLLSLLSSATRLVASLSNATSLPSSLIEGVSELPSGMSAVAPSGRLTSAVVWVGGAPVSETALRYTSVSPVAGPPRFPESEANATTEPSWLSAGESESPSPTAPVPVTRLTRMVWLVVRSRRYTSVLPFVSAPSSGPSQVKATRLPLSLITGSPQLLVRRGACRAGPAADERDRAGHPVLHIDVETASLSSLLSPSELDANATKRPVWSTDWGSLSERATGAGSGAPSDGAPLRMAVVSAGSAAARAAEAPMRATAATRMRTIRFMPAYL